MRPLLSFLILVAFAGCSSDGESTSAASNEPGNQEQNEPECPSNFDIMELSSDGDGSPCPGVGLVCPGTGGDGCFSFSTTATCTDDGWTFENERHDDCCPDEEPTVGQACTSNVLSEGEHPCDYGGRSYICADGAYCDRNAGPCP
jgi:hypothetical protein